MQTTKRNTVIVRNIMQKYSTFAVYTNKYAKCKTVKCNTRKTAATEIAAMCKEITTALQAANISFTIKSFVSNTYHQTPVTIVRFAT